MGRLQQLFFGSSLALSATVQASTADFQTYLSFLKKQAEDAGISAETIKTEFAHIKLFKRAEASTKKNVRSLETYLPAAATEERALSGQKIYSAHKAEYKALAEKYKVQPRFVLAWWGMASDYGQRVASYPILSVTASLAYEHQDDAKIYQRDFLTALSLIDNKQNTAEQLLSDSDGALGQLHLSASDYRDCGADGDNDGKVDIWNNPLDIFATAANCLKSYNWDVSQTWGRQVRAPKQLKSSLVGTQYQTSFSEWQALGVKRYDGKALPQRKDMKVSLIMPDGVNGRQYLIYDNYMALKKLQHDDYVVLAVAHLSEKIKALQID
ncbi:lytic murein transglycosylase [Shewanella sp. A32]|uniref:lytic murein transglycosylase n=1 Tax=Shewanella sp. A32 TaxID=3031327 RepID=UPI0023B8CC34|nr:lytic murein transglycosylase [Shewanella sp. A32]MDF0535955.1 lytic murein transglycosylase [Shewanella sp. A32]